VLRRIFRHKKEEVREVWRELHNEKLHNKFAPSILLKRTIQGRRDGQRIQHA
jgi:hypothetical protein